MSEPSQPRPADRRARPNRLEPQPLSLQTRIELPLRLDNTESFRSLLLALDDRNIREGLRERLGSLPPGVADIVRMSDDARLVDTSREATRLYREYRLGLTDRETLQSLGQDLRSYLADTYPSGLSLLAEWGRTVAPQIARMPTDGDGGGGGGGGGGTVGINADVVANAEVVVNAGVWANVAVATEIVVALAVFAVVGVFVF